MKKKENVEFHGKCRNSNLKFEISWKVPANETRADANEFRR